MLIQYYQELLNECIDIVEHNQTKKIMQIIFEIIRKGEEKWRYY